MQKHIVTHLANRYLELQSDVNHLPSFLRCYEAAIFRIGVLGLLFRCRIQQKSFWVSQFCNCFWVLEIPIFLGPIFGIGI